MATYVNDLRLKEIGTGESSGTWGTETNTNLELIGESMGYGTEAIADASTATITMADGATDGFRCTFLRLTGGGQACTVTLAPNTLSHTWIIRNTTSYALTFTQGSGANVIIAAGQVKIVSTDGLGSGAVVYECLEDLELGGTLTVGIDDAGYDVKFFGATSGAYMLWDESADDLKLVGAAGFTVAGDIDIDGTANLDVVDIDGAVDMASTLTLAGNADFNGDLDVDGTANLDVVDIDGAVDMASTLTLAGNADFNGDLDVDGTTNLDVVDIDGAVDMASTLAVAGVLTGASLDISGDIDIDGTSNLDVVDIDGAVDMASTLAVGGATTLSAAVTTNGGNFIFNEDSGDYDFRVESNGNANMLFVDGGSDEVGIGTASPAVELDVDGEIRAADGILFGTDTAAANALDDYEEGTYTPSWTVSGGGSVTDSGNTVNLGRYTKVGRLCTMSWRSYIVQTTGTITGYILTLPFQADSNSPATGMAEEFGQTGSGLKLVISVNGTTCAMDLYSGANFTAANSYMQGSITYQTA